MSDYPKIMTREGVEVTVSGAADEAEKRAEGFCSPVDEPVAVSECVPEAEPVSDDAEAEATTDDEPTFGAPSDATHTKRKGSNKKK